MKIEGIKWLEKTYLVDLVKDQVFINCKTRPFFRFEFLKKVMVLSFTLLSAYFLNFLRSRLLKWTLLQTLEQKLECVS